jgi:protein-tyrosine phosphatase
LWLKQKPLNKLIKISLLRFHSAFSHAKHSILKPGIWKNELKKYSDKKVHNFRTVGNIKNVDGRTLKEGMLYRSAHLHKLKRNLLMN